ncbi:putative ribonuclease H-like domain-containing protein [Tanacetum coccineum]
MDVKRAFLYSKIKEEVYVCQPPGFEDPDFLDKVYKVEKALYGLHQAHRAWYETLSTYLLENRFQRGQIDKTLFIKRDQGKLTFFLRLQVKQKEDRIFISQDKYVTEILKKFGFSDVKTASTPMETHKPLLKDEDGKDVDEHMYRSMISSLMYLTSSRPDIMFAVCLQTLVDGKKVILTKTSVRRDLQLEDAEGIECLPNVDIFEQLALMGFVQVFLDKQVGDMSTHYEIFVTPSHTKKVFGNIKRTGKGFSRAVTPLFPTIMVQAQGEMGKDAKSPQSSSPTKPIADEVINEENVPTQSNDPLLSVSAAATIILRDHLAQSIGEFGGVQIPKVELQAEEEEQRSTQVVSSEDEGLGDQEDASKQGRKIDDIDKDTEVTLVDETHGSEKIVEEVVSIADVSATAIITTEEITLAQALAELRSVKPKIVVKDKGKGKMVEEEPVKKMSKKELLKLNEELAFKLQAEEKEQARLEREKTEKVEEANIS